MTLSAKIEGKKSIKNKAFHKRNQLSSRLETNNDSDNMKYVSIFIQSKKRGNNSMDKRLINKNKIQQKIKSSVLPEKISKIKSNPELKGSSNIQNLKSKKHCQGGLCLKPKVLKLFRGQIFLSKVSYCLPLFLNTV